MELIKLRQSYPEFVYHGFETEQTVNTLKITYNFEISKLAQFRPHLALPLQTKVEIPKAERFIFLLGMVEALSYWKATCSPNFVIKAGKLNTEEVRFFEHLLLNGMGEFFYKNQINFTQPDFVEFIVKKKHSQSDDSNHQTEKIEKVVGDLILVGGGKESVVMLELLKKNDTEKTVMYVNPTPAAEAITKAAGIKNIIKVNREIDPQLLKLNDEGFLNGHTPFSAYLAFLGTLVAQIYRLENVIVGNEADANEANLAYLGEQINHQYSKTRDFENKFRLLMQHLNVQQNYFSLLRPLNELQIAYLFSKMSKYHELFISCNRKHGLAWCGECAKCVNSYLILTPFLEKKKLEKIFKTDFLIKEANDQILRQIVGLTDHKPFDCVTTYETAQNALLLTLKFYENGDMLPHLQKIKNELLIPPIKLLTGEKEYLTVSAAKDYLRDYWNSKHHLPQKYLQTVLDAHAQISQDYTPRV